MTTEFITALGGAIISFITGLFAVISSRGRKENETAHTDNQTILKNIDRRTEQIDNKLDKTVERLASHEGWHRGRGDEV